MPKARVAPLPHTLAISEFKLRVQGHLFLAATGRVMALTLVTADVRLLRGTGSKTLGNE